MANPRRNFYEDLGLRPGASGLEIETSYRAFRKKMDHVSVVPDPPREARMKLAYETLIDPARRAAYDAQLSAPRSEEGSRRGLFAVVGVVVIVAAVGAFFLLRSAAPSTAPVDRVVEELTRRAGLAVHRVGSVDPAGKPAPLGIAFAIGEGTVATSCNGISPASQLTLSIPPQPVPVTLAQVDNAIGVCKLAATGIGASPLHVAEEEPKAGDTVYMTQLDAAGKVALTKTQVTRVAPSSRGGTVVETSFAIPVEQRGGPVLDEHGRVIGMALPGEVVRLTPEWAAKPVEVPAQTATMPAAAGPAAATPANPPAAAPAPLPVAAPPAAPKAAPPKSPGSMTPEEVAEDRRRRLEEALQKNIR